MSDMIITNDIKYVGVNDRKIDLFEGHYHVPNGMAYNSYIIIDEKIAIMDSVDQNFGNEWLSNIEKVLGSRKPNYLVVQHMEPDHSANIVTFADKYPEAKIVSSAKAFTMMKNYFGTDFADRQVVVGEGTELNLGKHVLKFVAAPMVHWPEVIMTYDAADKILFSADAFGKFGALDADEPWTDEARRYYIGIVGKYGPQVQAVLKKAAALDIKMICPLHGPMLSDTIPACLDLYQKWSSYTAECDDILIAYTSVYGHTKEAAELLANTLKSKGSKVIIHDLARTDMSLAVADAFRFGKIVLATTTYNTGTDVVSDIIFLQKRETPQVEEPDWVHLAENGDGFAINSYFVDHPEMILGRQSSESTQYGRQDFTVEPIEALELSDQLEDAIKYIRGSYTEAELPDLGEQPPLEVLAAVRERLVRRLLVADDVPVARRVGGHLPSIEVGEALGVGLRPVSAQAAAAASEKDGAKNKDGNDLLHFVLSLQWIYEQSLISNH